MVALYRVDFPAGALGVELGPSRVSEVLARPEVFAAIPAPAYGEQGPLLFLRDAKRRVEVASRSPSRGIVFAVDGTGTTARRGGEPTRGCVAAVQSDAPLVEAGAIVAPSSLDYAARTALVLRRDGGLSFVATRGATSNELARQVIEDTDGSWAATMGEGPRAVLATRAGVVLGEPDTVADAWIVARLPAVSQSRFVEPAALPDVGAYPDDGSSLTAHRAPRAQDFDDSLQLLVGLGLLVAAGWMYYRDHK